MPTFSSEDLALRDRLNMALGEIRPRIRGHAGDVIVADVVDGRVRLDFLGACRGCPAQAFTFLAVVEPALLAVEGVRSVAPPRSVSSPAVRERIRNVIGATRSS